MSLPVNSIEDLCKAVAAPKRILAFPEWRRNGISLRLKANLEVDGIVLQGVTFLAQCNAERPDEQVTLNILAEIKPKERCIARIDWRGLGHGNRDHLCGGYKFTDAGRTHFHDPALHRGIDFAELFDGENNLPIALPIHPEPDSFNDLLARAADLLHIQNLTDMPVPPWETTLSL